MLNDLALSKRITHYDQLIDTLVARGFARDEGSTPISDPKTMTTRRTWSRREDRPGELLFSLGLDCFPDLNEPQIVDYPALCHCHWDTDNGELQGLNLLNVSGEFILEFEWWPAVTFDDLLALLTAVCRGHVSFMATRREEHS